jgi:hypothetical protein
MEPCSADQQIKTNLDSMCTMLYGDQSKAAKDRPQALKTLYPYSNKKIFVSYPEKDLVNKTVEWARNRGIDPFYFRLEVRPRDKDIPVMGYSRLRTSLDKDILVPFFVIILFNNSIVSLAHELAHIINNQWHLFKPRSEISCHGPNTNDSIHDKKFYLAMSSILWDLQELDKDLGSKYICACQRDSSK